ncbi:hypothetical protein Tco_0030175, partial [Tanacetum coccineum]
TGVTPGVLDVPEYESNDEQIFWKSSEEEDDNEVNMSNHDDDDDDEQTESNNDDEDFIHPKFSTHDDEARQEEDEDDNEEVQGVNIEGEAIDEAAHNEEDEGNELYRDLNVNLEGQDVEITDAQPTNVQITQVTEDTYVIITPVIPKGQQQSSSVSSGFVSNMLNPRPNTGIDSIINTKATSLVDVPVTTIAEPPLVFAITLPPPPTPLITHMQQTPFPIPTTAPTVSSIPGIVDAYLANNINDDVKTDVQLQSDRLRDEAQAENEDFLNKLDDIINKIIKEQVKEQVKA